VRILKGDCRDVLKTLPDESVHCVVTSPPYWGLRDYGHEDQIGHEDQPSGFVAALVQTFDEVRRALREDGTLWLNLGDSYAANRSYQVHNTKGADAHTYGKGSSVPAGLKPKDLVGIPWRVALALQEAGWWLRQDIIWSKPNPMPESVADRCTKSHEYLFLLAKGQWVSRVIQFTDIEGERFHLGQYIGAQKPTFREPLTGFCVSLASTIFDNAQAQHNFGLPPFYAEEWKKRANSSDSEFVRDHPAIRRLASLAARFLSAQSTAKEFVQEFDGLRLDLRNGNKFLIGRSESEGALPPAVDCNADGTVTVHDAGQICEFDFLHGKAIIRRPSGCTYYFDAAAIAEPGVTGDLRKPYAPGKVDARGNGHDGGGGKPRTAGKHSAMPSNSSGHRMVENVARAREEGADHDNPFGATRNKRSVWTVTTKAYNEAHFATFPPDLIEPCILAGCPEGGTVLDPFGGAGTTGLVADRHKRNAILIELNPEYAEMAKRRITNDSPLFAEVS